MLTEYGIFCSRTDEAKVVKNSNAFLVSPCGFWKMHKWPDRSIKPIGYPFEIDHYETQFLKEAPGLLFDIKPNYSMIGRIKFAEPPECGWTIFTKPFRESTDDRDLSDVTSFFKSLLESVGFPVLEIHRYANGQDQI